MPVTCIQQVLPTIVRENVRNTAKAKKVTTFWEFEKRKNVEVITYMPIALKTMVTTINQFCCLSHNINTIMFYSKMNSFNIMLYV